MGAEPHDELSRSERLIFAGADWVVARRRVLTLGALGLAFLVWLGSGFVVVESGHAAVVRRFGRLLPLVRGPGLHVVAPWPIDRALRHPVAEVQRIELKADPGRVLELATGDQNLIEAQVIAQYRVADLGQFTSAAEDPTTIVAKELAAALVAVAAGRGVDDLLTSGKVGLQNEVLGRAQTQLDRLGVGVRLVTVSVPAVTPPYEVERAFREVVDARSEASSRVSAARSQTGRQLELARAEAARMVREASSVALERRAQAEAAASSFEALILAGEARRGQVRSDALASRLPELLRRVRLVVLPPGSRPELQLHTSQRPEVATSGSGDQRGTQ